MSGAIPPTGMKRPALTLVSLLLFVTLLGGSSSAATPAPVALPDLTLQVPTDQISIGLDPSSGARQLRFTHLTADTGSGPFELDPKYDPTTGTATFTQAIYNSPSPGVWEPDHTVPVAVTGNWEPPDDYNFPLTAFTLNKVNADGSLGAVVATSPKTDYCMTGDTVVSGVASTPGQSFIPGDNCQDPTKPLGWSAGWGDQYDETDSGQPIDLTGVADGTYVLHGVVDPQHVLTENSDANNATDTELQISGTSITVLSQTNPDSTPPSVVVTSPTAGQQVSGVVTLHASALTNPSTTVASVRFLLDGQPLGNPVDHPPYTLSWNIGSTPLGPHLLTAQVTDSTGNTSTARPIPVTVVTRASTPLLGGLPLLGSGNSSFWPTAAKPHRGGKSKRKPGPTVRSVRWRRGVLTLFVSNFPKRASLAVDMWFVHRRMRRLRARAGRLRVQAPRPKALALRLFFGKRQVGRTIRGNLSSRPTVTITNPTSRETLSGVIPVVAAARDDMAVSAVHFAVDGKRIGTATAYPYVFDWRTTAVRPGNHRLTVVATNPTGHWAASSLIVNVENPRPPMTCFVLQPHVLASGRGTVTTPAFRTAFAGEALFAFVSADGPSVAQAQRATVSGAGLRWKLVQRANKSSGDSEIWSATAHRPVESARITSRLARSGFRLTLRVIAMESVTGAGSSAGASGRAGIAHVSLETRSATSLVFAVGNGRNPSGPGVLPTGWVQLDSGSGTADGDSSWAQYTNQPTGRSGTRVTAALASDGRRSWNVAAVELVNSGG